MRSKFFDGRLPMLALVLAAATACSQTPQSPVAPSAMSGGVLSDTASGATLKVNPPVPLAPIGGQVLDNRKPTFLFANASGRFVVPGQGQYRLEIYQGESLIDTRMVDADAAGGTSYAYPTDLGWETAYAWRARLEFEGAAGPWSAMATFSTPVEPRARLPFAVPASCGPQSPPNGNRLGCAFDVSVVSPEWPGCRSGSGVRCHRYTRHLAAALASSDDGWGLITKNANEQQCTWDSCGQSVRGGYGEDVVAWNRGGGGFNWEGWDVVVGAGAPGAQANWTRLPGRRAGNFWAPVPPFP